MKYKTLDQYPNYRIFEDGTVVKMSTYQTLKHTPKKGYYFYDYVTLRNKNNKRVQVNISKIIEKEFMGVL